MKRDFQEEYQNYIESDMPDLWSRIEPNLTKKDGQSEGGKNGAEKPVKVIYFLKKAVPVAACLCVLMIGIGVMGVSKRSFYENAGEGAAAADEEFTFMEEIDGTDDIMNESAAPAEAPMETAETEEAACMNEDSVEGIKTNGIEASGEAVAVERAVLSKIAVASEEMQEEGYAYAYTFRMEDNSRLVVYLTNDQCRELEENGVEIKRQAVYTLSVFPMKASESMAETDVGEGILENLEKLP